MRAQALELLARTLGMTRRSKPIGEWDAERFVRTIKEDCLDQLIVFGEDSLRNVVREFIAHYHQERNHQGLSNRLIDPSETTSLTSGAVQRRQRIGGMLNYYYREAA